MKTDVAATKSKEKKEKKKKKKKTAGLNIPTRKDSEPSTSTSRKNVTLDQISNFFKTKQVKQPTFDDFLMDN